MRGGAAGGRSGWRNATSPPPPPQCTGRRCRGRGRICKARKQLPCPRRCSEARHTFEQIRRALRLERRLSRAPGAVRENPRGGDGGVQVSPSGSERPPSLPRPPVAFPGAHARLVPAATPHSVWAQRPVVQGEPLTRAVVTSAGLHLPGKARTRRCQHEMGTSSGAIIHPNTPPSNSFPG